MQKRFDDKLTLLTFQDASRTRKRPMNKNWNVEGVERTPTGKINGSTNREPLIRVRSKACSGGSGRTFPGLPRFKKCETYNVAESANGDVIFLQIALGDLHQRQLKIVAVKTYTT
ncbi:hypothetical protein HZH66_001263 [Vespula vulgaris]|uniref:Uncharacterized protein n=1 Tax=Vespula vulgaris TaxID=7454 RepID=A0A834NK43_VESVU|nr:hypothetical protein HZH66_001263 [Vespula vulgaris]